jgi:GTP cyclohydrolase I
VKKQNAPEHLFEQAGQLLIDACREDPTRSGLVRTPKRYAKAMQHLLNGYNLTAEAVVGEGIFPSSSRGVVSVNEVEFYSMCEHHMLPFWGVVSCAYYPQDKIIGLSKIPRIIDLFARRLQVQEHLTDQVAKALLDLIAPKAVVVRAKAQHLCMMMRGVEKQNSLTVTESVIGLENLSDIERQRLFASLQT